MNMEMKRYWPQSKVFLFGQLAFLPECLENIALLKEQLRHYLQFEGVEELEEKLNAYQQEGYFKFKIIADQGEPMRYMITSVDHVKFHDELVLYLEGIKDKLPAEQRELVWSIAARQYKEHGYRPVIRWRDIYGDSARYNYQPPFWELVFIPVIYNQTDLKKISYDKVFPYLRSNDGQLKKMPKEMFPLYARPRTEFNILDKALQKRVAKLRGVIKHKATLMLTGKNLWLRLDGKSNLIKHYQGTKSNSYRMATELYNRSFAITKDELNLKPNTKTELKDLLSNAGFRGVVRELFIETRYDEKRRRHTLMLKKSVEVNEEEYDNLLDYVNSSMNKAE